MQTGPFQNDLSVRAARERYFTDNGFSEKGYSDAFVELKVGPMRLPFPNTKGRARAVRYHDLHHVVTEYATDMRGEALISAWEIGAGCGSSVAALVIDLA